MVSEQDLNVYLSKFDTKYWLTYKVLDILQKVHALPAHLLLHLTLLRALTKASCCFSHLCELTLDGSTLGLGLLSLW